MKRRLLVIFVISVLAAGAAVAVLRFWLGDDGVEISAHGYVAIGLGVGFTVLLGFGLMSLVYFSARRGYDAAAVHRPAGPRSDDAPPDKRA